LDPTKKAIWQEEIKGYVKRKGILDENIKKLYLIVWGQCSNAVQSELESLQEHSDVANCADGIKLLCMIQNLVHSYEYQNNLFHALHAAKCAFYTLHQGQDTPNEVLHCN